MGLKIVSSVCSEVGSSIDGGGLPPAYCCRKSKPFLEYGIHGKGISL